jgi:hypothetical protein
MALPTPLQVAGPGTSATTVVKGKEQDFGVKNKTDCSACTTTRRTPCIPMPSSTFDYSHGASQRQQHGVFVCVTPLSCTFSCLSTLSAALAALGRGVFCAAACFPNLHVQTQLPSPTLNLKAAIKPAAGFACFTFHLCALLVFPFCPSLFWQPSARTTCLDSRERKRNAVLASTAVKLLLFSSNNTSHNNPSQQPHTVSNPPPQS